MWLVAHLCINQLYTTPLTPDCFSLDIFLAQFRSLLDHTLALFCNRRRIACSAHPNRGVEVSLCSRRRIYVRNPTPSLYLCFQDEMGAIPPSDTDTTSLGSHIVTTSGASVPVPGPISSARGWRIPLYLQAYLPSKSNTEPLPLLRK